MKVAVNDVVRIKATGEVATVLGWAKYANRGTMLAVRVSVREERTVPVKDAEFVASAKYEPKGIKAAIMFFLMAVSVVMMGFTAHAFLSDYDVPVVLVLATVPMLGIAWFEAFYSIFVKPRKTRIS